MDFLISESGSLTPEAWLAINTLWPALAMLVGGWIAIGWLRKLMVKLLTKKMDSATAHFLDQIVRILLLIMLFMATLSQLGINTTSLLAALGAAGLAIGLALKDSLQNLASGFLLVALKPFKQGDYIEGAGTGGSVDRLTLSHTYLKTPDNKTVMIPNSSLIHSNLVNYSTESKRRLDLFVGVSYDDDVRKVKDLLLELANADERSIKDPAPLVAILNFGESSVDFTLRIWVNSADFWALKWDLMERIKISFDEQKITIPYPQRVFHQAEKS
ncbi:mechanosensitive ion channel family protein [Marinospirillum insulare]|uniref:Small-conductance mechanosensitive channel n=1 Tax=Marinospirillum insulare TaxID=217169 RepID=A0ABQ5ZUL3_9GAMM|nr:mechanosensitive ion channel domain-containing protein [Marinospirillum insulare]GLR62978.1 mechanosensitive ion channel protein [Marinospirillum insulare]